MSEQMSCTSKPLGLEAPAVTPPRDAHDAFAMDNIIDLVWESCLDTTNAAYRAASLLQAVADAGLTRRPGIIGRGQGQLAVLEQPRGLLFTFEYLPPSVNEILSGRRGRDARTWMLIREWWHDSITGTLRRGGRFVTPINPAAVLLRYRFPSKPAKDLSNHMVEKAIIDTLVDCGVLDEDDSVRVPMIGYAHVVDNHSSRSVGLDLAVVDAGCIDPLLQSIWNQILKHKGAYPVAA